MHLIFQREQSYVQYTYAQTAQQIAVQTRHRESSTRCGQCSYGWTHLLSCPSVFTSAGRALNSLVTSGLIRRTVVTKLSHLLT